MELIFTDGNNIGLVTSDQSFCFVRCVHNESAFMTTLNTLVKNYQVEMK